MAMGNIPFVAPGEEQVPKEADADYTRKIAHAKSFLLRQLSAGPRPATEVLLAAAAARIAEGTLYTAKRRLRVQSHRQGYEDGQWVWMLPTGRIHHQQEVQPTAPVGMS